jgi:ABC-type lipoprotein export system ATPase subunit
LPRIDILRSTPVEITPRVQQIQGIFDLPTEKVSKREWSFDFELPADWNVGLIVGSSGSGKSTIAHKVFGEHMVAGFDWDEKASVIDGFPKGLPVKDLSLLLSSVGFSSPPSWLRPYRLLSNGEQFRVSIARALAESREITVIDEFTSVVDRQVARIGSAAVQKTVRRRKQKFIAVSCHRDIAEWLEPDWVMDTDTMQLSVGRLLRRPPIELQIARVHHSAWSLFKHHHYLTAQLNHSAFCFCAFHEGVPVAFDAWLPFFGKSSRRIRRGHRTVCLPDYQGVGIGATLFTYVASMWKGLGFAPMSCTAHPAEIASRMRSPHWRMHRLPSRTAHDAGAKTQAHATNRMTAGFEYIGPGLPRDEAERVLNAA